MNRPALLTLIYMASTLCGAAPGETDLAAPPAKSASEIQGIDLRFDSSKPTFGEAESPTFSVHAATGKQMSDLRLWTFEDAHAIIYRKAEENLQLAAKSMAVDMDKKSAQLAGGVRVTSGRLIIDVADMAWDDIARIAKTDSVATLDDGANRITGESLSIHPDDDLIELGRGSGSIRLAAVAEKPAPAKDEKPSTQDKFDKIDIKKQQHTAANLSGRLREVKGPAEIELVGKDPNDSITVAADLVTFGYATDEDTSPSALIFKGRVVFTLSQGTVRTDQASVDFSAGKVQFRGKVSVELTQLRAGPMDSLDLDLNTGDIDISPGQIVSSLSFKPAPAKKP